jgi:hypothetical protein
VELPVLDVVDEGEVVRRVPVQAVGHHCNDVIVKCPDRTFLQRLRVYSRLKGTESRSLLMGATT